VTPLEENEIAVVPPVSANVWVVAAGAGELVGADVAVGAAVGCDGGADEVVSGGVVVDVEGFDDWPGVAD
jgi:hypothetical protein